ncbi:MAG TPA: oxygen-independent coproporphyrinogen III oxidase-like protein [Thiothrix sp.]|nr:oxygen-independent coproporphyrinogen III oxidase-like protein [Thiothrix sp.]
MTPIPLSLYIHIPWCIHKCPYCDFNSHEIKNITNTLPEASYIAALLHDLEQELPYIWGRRLHTIFIGGGTPSLLSGQGMKQLITGLRERLPLRPNMEITLEANPSTFEQHRFNAYYAAGINRLSIGIQSFNPRHLRILERIHDENEALQASNIANKAGFENINLDLMFGLPEQSIDEALNDLQQAIDCNPSHLSWYQLTIESNTFFHHQRPKKLPNNDQLANIQEAGITLLKQHGYHQYEVSAFAKVGKECLHNRNYWEFGDYIGIGAGAHGKISSNEQITRYHKHKHPNDYLAACNNGTARAKSHTLTTQDCVFEFMLNALRLKQGFNKTLFEERCYLNATSYKKMLEKAKKQGLLIETEHYINTTPRGWDFLNTTIEHFL